MKKQTVAQTWITTAIAAFLLTMGCQQLTPAMKQDDGERKWTFDKEQAGRIPDSWMVAETSGAGKTATWEIVIDDSVPSKPNAVAITESMNRGQTYNLLMAEEVLLQDVEVEVEVKALSGKIDQGGGPIWRAKDERNYYICRWNPLENNLRVYVVKDGKRKQLASADVDADAGSWHEIEIEHTGTKIIAEMDDKKLIVVEDYTFLEAGMAGLWTKADAATLFDNFEVEPTDDD